MNTVILSFIIGICIGIVVGIIVNKCRKGTKKNDNNM